jgi:phage-related protein
VWGWLKGAFNEMMSIVGTVVNFVKSHWQLLLGIITGPIGMAVYLISHYWKQITAGFAAAWSFIVTSGTTAANWLMALPGKILGWFANAGSWLYNAGMNIIEGLWNGIQSMGSWIANQIGSFIQSVVPGPVLKILGINSPSRVFHEIGVNVSQGLSNGILSGRQTVTASSTQLAVSTLRGFGSPNVALGVGGGRQMALAGVGAGSAGGAAVVQNIHLEVHGSVKSRQQLRDDVQTLMLQLGSRNSQTYQGYRR